MLYRPHALFLGTALAAIVFLTHARVGEESLSAMSTNKPTHSSITITVFVHGTMSVKHFLTVGNIMRMMRDNVEDTVYHKSLDIARENPLFFVNQAMQGYGLQPVDHLTTCSGNASGALAQLLMLSTQSVTSEQKQTDELFYTFGWPGTLSHNMRIKAGQELYESLSHQVKQLQASYKTIFIRIYGFSHGGNVALNVAQYTDDTPQFTIDELILLGTPIQSESDYLINNPIFAKVFNIFSAGDRVQQLDCFSFNRFFSGKRFVARTDFALPEKLTQIELRLTEPLQRKSGSNKKKIVHANLRKHPYLRDYSPGHSELWFFGWTPQYYRPHFPLNPLPTVVLLPMILSSPQLTTLSPNKYWIVDIRPSLEHCLVRLAKDRTIHPPIPLKADTIATLKQHAERFRPEPLIQKQYDDITYAAIKKAAQEEEAATTIASN